jgi:hypothetical protein
MPNNSSKKRQERKEQEEVRSKIFVKAGAISELGFLFLLFLSSSGRS